MKRAGKKTLAWEKERAKQKVKFFAMGITTCELKRPGCWRDNALGFCHIRKRRNLKPHELGIVVLGCNPCHDQIELLPEAEMTELLMDIITRRPQCGTSPTKTSSPNGLIGLNALKTLLSS